MSLLLREQIDVSACVPMDFLGGTDVFAFGFEENRCEGSDGLLR
jgi:hypothetical protein